MYVNINSTTLVISCQKHSAVAAIMSHVLERVHHVRDEAEAEREAESDASGYVLIRGWRHWD